MTENHPESEPESETEPQTQVEQDQGFDEKKEALVQAAYDLCNHKKPMPIVKKTKYVKRIAGAFISLIRLGIKLAHNIVRYIYIWIEKIPILGSIINFINFIALYLVALIIVCNILDTLTGDTYTIYGITSYICTPIVWLVRFVLSTLYQHFIPKNINIQVFNSILVFFERICSELSVFKIIMKGMDNIEYTLSLLNPTQYVPDAVRGAFSGYFQGGGDDSQLMKSFETIGPELNMTKRTHIHKFIKRHFGAENEKELHEKIDSLYEIDEQAIEKRLERKLENVSEEDAEKIALSLESFAKIIERFDELLGNLNDEFIKTIPKLRSKSKTMKNILNKSKKSKTRRSSSPNEK